MKKLSYIICCMLMALSSAMTSSCGDNTDFWGVHVLTDDEIAELARQDSIREAQRNTINANLVLEYNLDVTVSASNYDGGIVSIDLNAIANCFGITVSQLRQGLFNMRQDWYGYWEQGAEITGFCIQGSTHADVMSAYNTNSCWGHWWDENGDITEWGSNARVYAEWYDPWGVEEGDENSEAYFIVGQMPGTLTAGNTYKFIECLKYQDLRVAVVINVIAKDREEVKASVVSTQKLSLETPPNNGYVAFEVPGFDADKVLADLGVSSFDNVAWVAPNADGSYAQEYSADAPGFWYDLEGYAGTWGDNASVFTHFDAASQIVTIGQMPEVMKEGDEITVKFGALANNKIAMLEINLKIVAFKDPETKPEGEPYETSKDVTLSKPYSEDYASVEDFDAIDIIKDALKLTTYELYKGLNEGTVKVYLNEVTDADPAYTAGTGEYWINAEGNSVDYGSGSDILYTGLYAESETYVSLEAGCHPDNVSPTATTTVKYKLIVVGDNGGKVTLNITATITPKE